MTREEKISAAAALRERGSSYTQIARQVGVSRATIARWLDPEYARRCVEGTKRWRDQNGEYIRKRDRDYYWRRKLGVVVTQAPYYEFLRVRAQEFVA